jgi:SAM-dependent methyltransferase
VSKHEFLDLGRQPIANRFLNQDEFEDEFFYDLKVGFDTETCLVTHMKYVDAPMMFNDDYSYRGSMSATMRNHFSKFSKSIKTSLPISPKVLEIGSNDGVFIKNWDTKTSFAVEPCGNFAKETNDLGYKTYNDFWTKDLANKILIEQGDMDLVFSANCMCHIPDLDEAFSAVESILSLNGVFIFEDPSLLEMINVNSYDQIYDEHPHIFSITALNKILERNGLKIVKVENTNVHGGSNRVWVKKCSFANPHKSVQNNLDLERLLGLYTLNTMERFAEKVQQSKLDLRQLLIRCEELGKKVISYGATSKSTTIFNYCNIGPSLIQYITDTTPEKQDKYSPGVHIPIISPEQGFNNTIDFAFLGAWNFAQEIRSKEKDFNGKFITHVPTVRLL